MNGASRSSELPLWGSVSQRESGMGLLKGYSLLWSFGLVLRTPYHQEVLPAIQPQFRIFKFQSTLVCQSSMQVEGLVITFCVLAI